MALIVLRSEYWGFGNLGPTCQLGRGNFYQKGDLAKIPLTRDQYYPGNSGSRSILMRNSEFPVSRSVSLHPEM